MPFDQLDFIYMPSGDVAGDVAHFVDCLEADLVFAIEAFGTRVAMVRPGAGPDLLLAEHLHGERPILVYRVGDLDGAAASLRSRGWDPGPSFGIPYGPCCSFTSPGGHRLAIYERTRPGVAEHLEGRRDF